MRGLRRLGGFAASVALLGVASLTLLPATIGAAGLVTYSSIVIGQALALIVQTLAGWGYGVNGPAVIATRSAEDGVSYFRIAQRTRFVVATPCFALMVCLMFIIPNPNPVAGLLGSAHLAIGAFSATFFYIGRAAPLWQLLAETVPRVAGMFAGAIALTFRAPLLIGLSLPALGALLAVLISNATIFSSTGRRHIRSSFDIRIVLAEMRIQRGPAVVSVLRGARDAVPTFILAAVATDLVGAFGVFDRVQRQAIGALAPLTSTLQGWVPKRMAHDGSSRPVIVALFASLLGASVIFSGFALSGGPIIRWLAAATLHPSLVEIMLCSAIIATGILNQLISFACLIPLGGIRDAMWCSIAGIVAVFLTFPVLVPLERSVTGALLSILIATLTQICFQLVAVRRRIGRGRYLHPAEGA